MNKQGPNGIEWTHVFGAGTGYTWNAVGGCQHGCRWKMPGGVEARCYAEDTAENTARAAYPYGFEHHYWRPDKLDEPIKHKQPAGIFLDSMSDLMGHWVPDEQIEAVLDTCRKAHWHVFFLLTKAAPRLLKFRFPNNVWVGISSPPDVMFGNREKPVRMSATQKWAYWEKAIDVFNRVDAAVRWFSVEPLTDEHTGRHLMQANIQWCVIGAASSGKRYYQPDPLHVASTLKALDLKRCPTFFKGNLRPSLGIAFDRWREAFPDTAGSVK